MDPIVKIMGTIDVIAAIFILLQSAWLPLQIIAILLLIKGIISLAS